MIFTHTVIPFVLAGSAFAAHVQKPDLQLPPSARFYRNAVRNIFVESYDAYRKYAWGHDNVSPLSHGDILRCSLKLLLINALSRIHGWPKWLGYARLSSISCDYITGIGSGA